MLGVPSFCVPCERMGEQPEMKTAPDSYFALGEGISPVLGAFSARADVSRAKLRGRELP